MPSRSRPRQRRSKSGKKKSRSVKRQSVKRQSVKRRSARRQQLMPQDVMRGRRLRGGDGTSEAVDPMLSSSGVSDPTSTTKQGSNPSESALSTETASSSTETRGETTGEGGSSAVSALAVPENIPLATQEAVAKTGLSYNQLITAGLVGLGLGVGGTLGAQKLKKGKHHKPHGHVDA